MNPPGRPRFRAEGIFLWRAVRRDLSGDPLVAMEDHGRYHERLIDPDTGYLSREPRTAIIENS